MPVNAEEIYTLLERCAVPYERTEHPAVYHMAEMEEHSHSPIPRSRPKAS